MGNACSPQSQLDNNVTMEEPVDPKLQFVPTENDVENRQKLKQIIAEYQSQIASLDKELNTYNEQIQQKQDVITRQTDECVNIEEMLREEMNRVAKLKLQSELRDKELKIAQQNLEENVTKTKTMMEGVLFKFGRAGKLNPKQKWVWFHVLDNGVPVIDWSESQESTTVNRLVVSRVFTDETLVSGDYYRERVFAVETLPQRKVLVFAASDFDECKRWYHIIHRSIAEAPEGNGDPEPVVFELTFEKRPLGFGVDIDFLGEKLLVTSVQNEELGLVEGVRVVSCNETLFEGKTHNEMIDTLTYTPAPITIRFSGTPEQLHGLDIENADKGHSANHSRSLSMAELFPAEQLYNNSPNQHPLVKSNPEFKKWLENPAFETLMKELSSNPQKLNEFMKNADI